MSSRTLFCGDIHCHLTALKQIEELSNEYDKVVFLGDYVDDWGASPEVSKKTLEELINFKKANPDKVILTLGNHDLSEWQGNEFRCSGHSWFTSELVRPIFDENEELFDIAYAPEGIEALATHAGITKSWWDKYCSEVPYEGELKAKNYADALNWSFHHRNDDQQANDIFYGLSSVGYARGGYKEPSPIWADLNEMIADAMPNLTQVVGHTPVHIATHYLLDKDTDFYACDTHSTFRDGKNIGDNSLLVLEDFRFYKVGLDNKKISW